MSIEMQPEQKDILDVIGIETLTSTQLTFIKSVLCGLSLTAAALASGISRRTATTWMQPGHEIRQAYERAKAQYNAAIFERLKRIQMLTLDALEASLSPEAPPAVRFNTAKFLYAIQFNTYGDPRNLPRDPDDCPQPRQPTGDQYFHDKPDFYTIHYEGLTEEEIQQVEDALARYQKAREARNADGYHITVDLLQFTTQEANEFEALATELEYRRLVRLGEATEKDIAKWQKEDAKKRR